jgi:DNA polymerase
LNAEQKMELLGQLYDNWSACTRCGLCTPKGRERGHVVFGEGNPDANLLIVGEAPGAHEDITGHPFAGKSGEVVDEMLRSFCSSRDEVFITNVVGCRPTEDENPKVNRPPTKDEVAACSERVARIIDIVDPYVVLILGKTAMTALTQEKGLTKLAKSASVPEVTAETMGRFVPVARPAFVTFHPAYLLRNWDTSEKGDVHKAYRTWEKAFYISDAYAEIYKGITPPIREKQDVR